MSLKVAPDAAVDLQLHTTYSDGVWTASQLLDYVAGEGFALIAVTDHERPDTSLAIQRLAAERHPGLHVLAAAEMSSTWDGLLADILCFGFDPADNALMPLAKRIRDRQLANFSETIDALKRKGHQFPRQQELLAASGGEPQTLDDIINLMVESGYSQGMGDALRGAGFRWITEEPAVIVEAAHASGAVCLIAHPGRGDAWPLFDAAEIDRFRAVAPVDGLEIYHPTHSPESSAEYIAYAERHNLLVSTGSDSHGKSSQWPIKYRAETSRKLLERLGVEVG